RRRRLRSWQISSRFASLQDTAHPCADLTWLPPWMNWQTTSMRLRVQRIHSAPHERRPARDQRTTLVHTCGPNDRKVRPSRVNVPLNPPIAHPPEIASANFPSRFPADSFVP